MKPPLSVEEFRRRFYYNPATGIFWRRGTGKVWGKLNPKLGYVMTPTPGASVKIPGSRQPQYAHVLAWWYVTGEWPAVTVDHRNRVKHDNRWDNLRLATMSQQQHNVGPKRNASRFPGASRNHKRWRALVNYQGKRICAGNYDTPQEASSAYQAKRRELAGEFVPTAQPAPEV